MTFRTISPWLSRVIILAVAGLFVMISFKFVFHPQQAAALSGITIEPGIAFTNTRAGFGGFPLGIAAILLFCLFSAERLLPALASIATIAGIILVVRLYGAAQDGTFGPSAHLLIPETIILAVAIAAAWLETRRRAREPKAR
jgi:hypothetical protein